MALGDSAEQPRYIETVARRGYRFVGEVEKIGEANAPEAAESGAAEPPRRWVRQDRLRLVSADELVPNGRAGTTAFGYMDSFHRKPYRLTLKERGPLKRALEGHPEPYTRLDTAVLEAVRQRLDKP